jgi:hypothetical protein
MTLLEDKNYNEQSVFLPENLLREARRQKDLKDFNVPRVCVLDPDGDIVRYLKKNSAKLSSCWACYHSGLYSMLCSSNKIRWHNRMETLKKVLRMEVSHHLN